MAAAAASRAVAAGAMPSTAHVAAAPGAVQDKSSPDLTSWLAERRAELAPRSGPVRHWPTIAQWQDASRLALSVLVVAALSEL